jgi:hypothetical protein
LKSPDKINRLGKAFTKKIYCGRDGSGWNSRFASPSATQFVPFARKLCHAATTGATLERFGNLQKNAYAFCLQPFREFIAVWHTSALLLH